MRKTVHSLSAKQVCLGSTPATTGGGLCTWGEGAGPVLEAAGDGAGAGAGAVVALLALGFLLTPPGCVVSLGGAFVDAQAANKSSKWEANTIRMVVLDACPMKGLFGWLPHLAVRPTDNVA